MVLLFSNVTHILVKIHRKVLLGTGRIKISKMRRKLSGIDRKMRIFNDKSFK